uniref:RNA methyltransferase n=1 Tax=Thermosphaera aggregans TaxID=54254 RepID=A0A7C2BKP1_9CREN
MTEIDVAIPTSILQVESTLLLKTLRIHQVARTLGIFGVSKAFFYKDFETGLTEHREFVGLIRKQWEYFYTPPYLRRRLVPKSPLLKHVGILPPLRLDWFDVPRGLKPGDERVGYVFRKGGGFKVYVDSSRVFNATGDCREGLAVIRITDPEGKTAECLDKDFYKGPELRFTDSFKQLVEENRDARIVATSRYGRVPGFQELSSLASSNRVLILFGSPRRGLHDIARAEGVVLEELGDVWNTVPGQRVKTVRTEEALIITLGLVNHALKLKRI